MWLILVVLPHPRIYSNDLWQNASWVSVGETEPSKISVLSYVPTLAAVMDEKSMWKLWGGKEMDGSHSDTGPDEMFMLQI